MKAVVKKGTNNAELKEIEGKIGEGETKVRTIKVGIDSTDRQVLNKEDGDPYPEGGSYLVMGHEAVGMIEKSEKFEKGAYVVPTVRRPTCGCKYAEIGRSDFCPKDHYLERGIKGLHGFGCEFFYEKDENLVEIPEEVVDIGVLLEPLSVFEKAFSEIKKAQKRIPYEPEKCLVLGAGALGLISAIALENRGMDVTVVDIVSEKHSKAKIVEEIGGTYINNRKKDLKELGRFDFILEASGVSKQLIDGVKVLSNAGGMVSLGLPRTGSKKTKCDVGAFHEEMVRGNKLLLGSVNSSKKHFIKAVEELKELNKNFELERLIDTSVPPEEFMKSFMAKIKGEIVFED